MKKEYAIFTSAINDTKGLYRLVDQLSSINKNLYHNLSGSIVAKTKGFLTPSLEIIFGYLEEQGLEPEGDSAQKQFLEEIISELKKVPLVKITLAFEPDDSFTAKLNETISNQVNQKIFLDILVNHHIVGGVVLEYQGKFKDYSLEPRVDQYLKEAVKRQMFEDQAAAKVNN